MSLFFMYISKALMGHWSTLYPSKEAAFNEVEVVSLKIGKASGVAIGQLCLFALSRCSGKTVGISTNTKDAQTMCSQLVNLFHPFIIYCNLKFENVFSK